MGRPPCCDKAIVKKGPWTAEEDAKLLAYTSTHGIGNWTSVPQKAGYFPLLLFFFCYFYVIRELMLLIYFVALCYMDFIFQ